MGAPTVPPLFENWHDGGFLVSEANGHRSRDGITLTGGVYVLAGTVLAQTASPSTGAEAPVAFVTAGTSGHENAGDGMLTISAPPLPGVTPAGRYTCTFTSRNSFDVTGPGDVTERAQSVGAPVTISGMTFSIAAGAKRFTAGDTFSIIFDATGTPGVWTPWNPGGAQSAAGLLFGSRDTTRMDRPAVAITRDAEVNASELVWPVGVTPEQIATAREQLQAVGILLR
jgi:hypothetical protein